MALVPEVRWLVEDPTTPSGACTLGEVYAAPEPSVILRVFYQKDRWVWWMLTPDGLTGSALREGGTAVQAGSTNPSAEAAREAEQFHKRWALDRRRTALKKGA